MLSVCPQGPASAVYCGAVCTCSPDSPAIFPLLALPERQELFFELWPAPKAHLIPVPEMHCIVLEAGRPVISDIPLVDWGAVIEAEPVPGYRRDIDDRSYTVLSSAEYSGGEAQLILHGGFAELSFYRRGAYKTIPIGRTEKGKVRTVDFGSAVLLCVETSYEGGETLSIFGADRQPMLIFSGDLARIVNGVPTSIVRLDRVSGHERRRAYDLKGGSFEITEDETGFFTSARRAPASEQEAALMLFESAKLGMDDEVSLLIAPELRSELTSSALIEFTGPFDRVLLYPFEEPEGSVTVGLCTDSSPIMHPRIFKVLFSDMLAVDIREP